MYIAHERKHTHTFTSRFHRNLSFKMFMHIRFVSYRSEMGPLKTSIQLNCKNFTFPSVFVWLVEFFFNIWPPGKSTETWTQTLFSVPFAVYASNYLPSLSPLFLCICACLNVRQSIKNWKNKNQCTGKRGQKKSRCKSVIWCVLWI